MLVLCFVNVFSFVSREGTDSLGSVPCRPLDKDYLNMELRRWSQYPSVEYGSGAFKSEIITFPANKLQQDLKKLLLLKNRMEKESRKRFRRF